MRNGAVWWGHVSKVKVCLSAHVSLWTGITLFRVGVAASAQRAGFSLLLKESARFYLWAHDAITIRGICRLLLLPQWHVSDGNLSLDLRMKTKPGCQNDLSVLWPLWSLILLQVSSPPPEFPHISTLLSGYSRRFYCKLLQWETLNPRKRGMAPKPWERSDLGEASEICSVESPRREKQPGVTFPFHTLHQERWEAWDGKSELSATSLTKFLQLLWSWKSFQPARRWFHGFHSERVEVCRLPLVTTWMLSFLISLQFGVFQPQTAASSHWL